MESEFRNFFKELREIPSDSSNEKKIDPSTLLNKLVRFGALEVAELNALNSFLHAQNTLPTRPLVHIMNSLHAPNEQALEEKNALTHLCFEMGINSVVKALLQPNSNYSAFFSSTISTKNGDFEDILHIESSEHLPNEETEVVIIDDSDDDTPDYELERKLALEECSDSDSDEDTDAEDVPMNIDNTITIQKNASLEQIRLVLKKVWSEMDWFVGGTVGLKEYNHMISLLNACSDMTTSPLISSMIIENTNRDKILEDCLAFKRDVFEFCFNLFGRRLVQSSSEERSLFFDKVYPLILSAHNSGYTVELLAILVAHEKEIEVEPLYRCINDSRTWLFSLLQTMLSDPENEGNIIDTCSVLKFYILRKAKETQDTRVENENISSKLIKQGVIRSAVAFITSQAKDNSDILQKDSISVLSLLHVSASVFQPIAEYLYRMNSFYKVVSSDAFASRQPVMFILWAWVWSGLKQSEQCKSGILLQKAESILREQLAQVFLDEKKQSWNRQEQKLALLHVQELNLLSHSISQFTPVEYCKDVWDTLKKRIPTLVQQIRVNNEEHEKLGLANIPEAHQNGDQLLSSKEDRAHKVIAQQLLELFSYLKRLPSGSESKLNASKVD